MRRESGSTKSFRRNFFSVAVTGNDYRWFGIVSMEPTDRNRCHSFSISVSMEWRAMTYNVWLPISSRMENPFYLSVSLLLSLFTFLALHVSVCRRQSARLDVIITVTEMCVCSTTKPTTESIHGTGIPTIQLLYINVRCKNGRIIFRLLPFTKSAAKCGRMFASYSYLRACSYRVYTLYMSYSKCIKSNE